MAMSLIDAALEQLKPEPGYQLVKAYTQTQGDEEFVVLLLDYGIHGCKKYRVKIKPVAPSPVREETVREVKTTVKRRR